MEGLTTVVCRTLPVPDKNLERAILELQHERRQSDPRDLRLVARATNEKSVGRTLEVVYANGIFMNQTSASLE